MCLTLLFKVIYMGLLFNDVLSIRVDQEKQVNEMILLKCDVGSDPNVFEPVSWIMINGKEETVLTSGIEWNGNLRLTLTHAMHGAQVMCRSHYRQQRHLVSVSPPYQIHLMGQHDSHKTSIRKVVATVGDVTTGDNEETITCHEGEQIEITCTAVNIVGFDSVGVEVYVYVILRNDRNNTEIELGVSYPTEKRRPSATARLTLTMKEHYSQVYCLARWFDHFDLRYANSTGLRSAPLTVLVEPQAGVSYMYLWIAIGVGALGWLVLMVLGIAFVCRPRNVDSSNEQEEQTSQNHDSKTVCCFGRNNRSVRGATVMPLRAAQSLAAANVKLTPTSCATVTPTAPIDDDQITYANLQELNNLVGRKQWQ